jgi:FkbM family methyltransferase
MTTFSEYIKKNFPELARLIRTRRMVKAFHSKPQYSNELDLKFWGIQQIDSYEPSITRTLDSIINNAQVFINVGANHGIYSLRYAKKGKEVIAFEALQENVDFLLKNVKENGLVGSVTVFPVAVSSRKSIEKFFGMSSGGSLLRGWNSQYDQGKLVQCMDLDYLILDKIAGKSAVFLIDVEGAEFQVLEGALEIIRKHKESRFVVEIPTCQFMPDEKFNPNFYKTFDLFFSCGYLAYEIQANGELQRLDKNLVCQMEREKRYEGLMTYFCREG